MKRKTLFILIAFIFAIGGLYPQSKKQKGNAKADTVLVQKKAEQKKKQHNNSTSSKKHNGNGKHLHNGNGQGKHCNNGNCNQNKK